MTDPIRPDDARTARAEALTEELLSDPGYLSGRTRFPRRLSRDEGADLAGALAEQVDRAAAARSDTAARQHLPIVCDRGCSACCEEPVLVFLPEAAAIARWLMREDNRAARDAFLAAFPAWQKATGDGPARLAERAASGDNAGFVALHRAEWRRGILCAFNQGGDCTVYPVRPLACRNAHAIETPARCSGAHSGPPAARLAFPQLDEYLAGASQVLRAAHHALGGDRGRPMAVCESVFRLLQSDLAAERKRDRARARDKTR